MLALCACGSEDEGAPEAAAGHAAGTVGQGGSGTIGTAGGGTGNATGGSSAAGSGSGGKATAGSGGRAAAGSGGKAAAGSGGKAAAGSGGKAAAGEAGAGGAVEPGAVDCAEDGDGKTTLAFVNRCPEAVTFRGSDIDGGTVAPGAFTCVDIGSDAEELSAKRYWGFVGDDPGAEHHTLAEFTFNTDFNDFDWYNISHVDAFNLPMQITPLARPDCKTLTCADDFVPGCPDVGKYENDEGELIACVSPDRNDGNSEVALYFEACDDAYAWSGDDQNGDDPSPVRACAGEDWDITFCPEGGS